MRDASTDGFDPSVITMVSGGAFISSAISTAVSSRFGPAILFTSAIFASSSSTLFDTATGPPTITTFLAPSFVTASTVTCGNSPGFVRSIGILFDFA